jgi:hypothetical protein
MQGWNVEAVAQEATTHFIQQHFCAAQLANKLLAATALTGTGTGTCCTTCKQQGPTGVQKSPMVLLMSFTAAIQ